MKQPSIRTSEIVRIISTGDPEKWEESPHAVELIRHLVTILIYLHPGKGDKSIIREIELILCEDQAIFQEEVERVSDQAPEFIESVEYWKPRISFNSPEIPKRNPVLDANIPIAQFLVSAYLSKGTHRRSEGMCPKCGQWLDTSITICPNCRYEVKKDEQRRIKNDYSLIFIYSFGGLLILMVVALLGPLQFLMPLLLPGFISLTFGFFEGREAIRNWPNHKPTADNPAKRVRFTFAAFDILMVWGIVWGFVICLYAKKIDSLVLGILGMLMVVGGFASAIIPGITAFRHSMFPQTPSKHGFKTVWVRGARARIGAVVWIVFFFLAGLAATWTLGRTLFIMEIGHSPY